MFSFPKKRRRARKIFLLFLIIISFTICFFYLLKIKRNFSSLPTYGLSCKEKSDLRLFFHDLFADNELGYTLFGDKPMSLGIPNVFPPRFSKKDFSFIVYLEDACPLFSGLAAWKKICSKIKKESYLLIICEEKLSPNFVILINKKAFAKKFGLVA